MRKQVTVARKVQQQRFATTSTRYNGQMTSRQVRQFCALNREGHSLMKACVEDLGLSARAHDKILRVARTLADLEEAESISEAHLQEAINYRMLDRQVWV